MKNTNRKAPHQKEKNSRDEVLKGRERIKRKTEEAKVIAERSQRVMNQYKNIEVWVVKKLKALSLQVDEIMLKPRRGKVLALIIAIFMYIAVNGTISLGLLRMPGYGETLTGVAVTVVGNDVYEVNGMPEMVDIYLVGDLSDIQMTKSQAKYQVVADLKGMGEGIHQVDLKVINVTNRLSATASPSSVNVTLKKKEAKVFTLNYEFINEDKKDDVYILGKPEIEFSEVTVTASNDTLKNIATVKAIIDVNGVTETFTKEVDIIAYDQKGERMDVQILPNKVNVKVPITSPYKEVPLIFAPEGTIPNNMAIAEINAQRDTIRIYGSDNDLNKIDEIRVPIDGRTLTQAENKRTQTIFLREGLSSPTKTVTVDIRLEAKSTKVLKDIPVNYKNNVNGYGVSSTTTLVDVTVEGTEKVLEAFDPSNILVYVDIKDLPFGESISKLYVINNGDVRVIPIAVSPEEITITIGQGKQ